MQKKLEFKGGWAMAFIPTVIFLVFCVLYFVVFKAFEMYALAMGAFVGLLVGALFTQKGQYGAFWDAVYAGVILPSFLRAHRNIRNGKVSQT